MTFKLISTVIAVGLASLGFNACQSASNTNANMHNINSNTAVVVNNNSNMMTNMNSHTSNANRWNANITREEYERNKSEYEREKGSSTIGQGANDMWLWVKTRSSLLGTNDLRESTINVDVVNDVVTLKGSVETAVQKAKAEQVAKGIEGVKSVKNELRVQPNDSMTNQMTTGNSNSNTNKR
jgi:hyperosmotically inducible periplasmic protein